MHGSFSWLGTLGGHDVFVPVFIMLLSVIIEGFIAMLAMALVVCFFSGNGSVQEPDASSLAVCWKDIGHVLGLRIVGLGCGGCQARGLSVAWLAQATPRVDVAEVSFASSGLMGSGTKKMKDPRPALPEFIDSDADPAFQIFVVLFSGRSRCVMVRAFWGVPKLVDIVAEMSEVPAQHFISRVVERY